MKIINKTYVLAIALLSILAGAANAHSDAFKPAFVETLVQPYLTIQKGLAADDLSTAQTGAKTYLEALKHGPSKGPAAEEAMDLAMPAKAIASASDIKAARKEFLALSVEINSLVKHVGTTKHTSLYLAKCPMAFDGKGGIWLQEDKKIANPYYGSMMFRCGSVQEQVVEGMDMSAMKDGMKMDGHSGHGAEGHAH